MKKRRQQKDTTVSGWEVFSRNSFTSASAAHMATASSYTDWSLFVGWYLATPIQILT